MSTRIVVQTAKQRSEHEHASQSNESHTPVSAEQAEEDEEQAGHQVALVHRLGDGAEKQQHRRARQRDLQYQRTSEVRIEDQQENQFKHTHPNK